MSERILAKLWSTTGGVNRYLREFSAPEVCPERAFSALVICNKKQGNIYQEALQTEGSSLFSVLEKEVERISEWSKIYIVVT